MYHNQRRRLNAWFLVTLSSACLHHCGILANNGLPALNATCNIPVLPSLSIREFQASFKGRHPVIFRRTVSESEAFRTISSYDYLVEHMGSVEIELASSNSFSHDRIRVRTREYLESINKTSDGTARANETFYFFGTLLLGCREVVYLTRSAIYRRKQQRCLGTILGELQASA